MIKTHTEKLALLIVGFQGTLEFTVPCVLLWACLKPQLCKPTNWGFPVADPLRMVLPPSLQGGERGRQMFSLCLSRE